MKAAATLQFGRPETELNYTDRPAVFGLLIRDGQVATVRVTRDAPYHDLPGGAIEAGETEAEALVREFQEETGLLVAPQTRLVEVSQYFLKSDGAPVNNIGGVWTVGLLEERPETKIENDHKLVWLPVDQALRVLRHDAHAWAIATLIRQETRNETGG